MPHPHWSHPQWPKLSPELSLSEPYPRRCCTHAIRVHRARLAVRIRGLTAPRLGHPGCCVRMPEPDRDQVWTRLCLTDPAAQPGPALAKSWPKSTRRRSGSTPLHSGSYLRAFPRSDSSEIRYSTSFWCSEHVGEVYFLITASQGPLYYRESTYQIKSCKILFDWKLKKLSNSG